MHVDLFGKIAGEHDSPLVVTIADEEVTATKDFLSISTLPDFQEESWTLTLASPEGGPFVLIDVLTVGNADSALVITGPLAFKTRGAP